MDRARVTTIDLSRITHPSQNRGKVRHPAERAFILSTVLSFTGTALLRCGHTGGWTTFFAAPQSEVLCPLLDCLAVFVAWEVAVTENWTRKDFLAELEGDGDSFFGAGFWNNITDLGLTISTVLVSLVATVLATDAQHLPHWVLASVAAIPAAAASLQRIVGIRERSNWYFMYAAEVRALATKLKFSNTPDLEAFAHKRAEIELEMEKAWTRIGNSGMPSRASRSSGRIRGR